MKKHKIIAALLLLALCLPLASCVAEPPAATGEETATATATAPVNTEVPDTRTTDQVLADYKNDLKEVFACDYIDGSDVLKMTEKMQDLLKTSSDSLDSLIHGKAEHYRPALREFLFEEITSNLAFSIRIQRLSLPLYVMLIRFMALEPDYWAPIEWNRQTFTTKEEFFNLLFGNLHLREQPRKSDLVFFGSYPMINQGEPIPLLWYVIGAKDGKALLRSVFAVDMNYYYVADSTYYEDSLVRKWLNETFYFTSFSDAEKKRIIETELVNGELAGPNTRDRVFLGAWYDLQPFFDSPVGPDNALKEPYYMIPRLVELAGYEYDSNYVDRDCAYPYESKAYNWDRRMPIVPHMVIDIIRL